MTPFRSARRTSLQRILAAFGTSAACTLGLPGAALAQAGAQSGFNVRAYGARGDGSTLDTDAINAAIAAASAAGGGTVLFPAGRYLSFSIRRWSTPTATASTSTAAATCASRTAR